jgi:hypothetical protein
MFRITLAGLLLGAAALPAAAQVSLNGWDVGKKDGTCIALHAYKDKDDDDAANAISLGLVKAPQGQEILVISIFYEKWKNTEDEEADFYVGKRRMLTGAKWKMHDKNTLTGTFTGARQLIDEMAKSRELMLQFDAKTKAYFKMQDPSQALGALQYCFLQ